MQKLFDPKLYSDNASIPFDELKNEDFPPAFAEAIDETKSNVKKLAAITSADFKNTIEGIEFHREKLDLVSTIFFNLDSANTNDFFKSYAKEISPKLAELGNDLLLNEQIFANVKTVFDKRAALSLNQEQSRLLEKTYKAFRRNGALLKNDEKEKLRKIDQRLAVLSQEFSDHVLKATNNYSLVVRDKKDLAGLPSGVIEQAASTAAEQGEKDAYVFTHQFPSYFPFMQYAENAQLRKEIWTAYTSRATSGETNNKEILKEIVTLKKDRAALLGYASHAAFVLEERMASTPKRVHEFLEEILTHSLPAGKKDFEEIRAFKESLSGEKEIYPWDMAFYSEKLKNKKFNLSDEELRPYFKLENVIHGVFEHAKRLYGLEFQEQKDIPVYHPDVKAYRVQEGDKFIGLFYADFFPRASKRGGAWMTAYREQGTHYGKKLRPHVSIVCNFTKPTATKPSLLDLREVETLFHEFGHALHGLLSDCHYTSLSGPNVYWDFVELPSQVMENWATEKESLEIFARHFETNEVLPNTLVQKIKAAENFQAGLMSVRQVSLGLLDLAWHTGDPSQIQDVELFEYDSIKRALFFPRTPGSVVSPTFSHIFAGGYSAGYYSYKWAEVLDADAFEFFLEKGIFNPEVAKKFRDNVLSRGGTEDPMELYKRFRGREPDPKALLRRDGLLK